MVTVVFGTQKHLHAGYTSTHAYMLPCKAKPTVMMRYPLPDDLDNGVAKRELISSSSPGLRAGSASMVIITKETKSPSITSRQIEWAEV